MTLAIFGFGVFVFFVTVYAVVVAGGLQLNAYQVRGEPALGDELSVGKKSAGVAENDTKSTDLT
jgi:hypothetical protein